MNKNPIQSYFDVILTLANSFLLTRYSAFSCPWFGPLLTLMAFCNDAHQGVLLQYSMYPKQCRCSFPSETTPPKHIRSTGGSPSRNRRQHRFIDRRGNVGTRAAARTGLVVSVGEVAGRACLQALSRHA
jgi:hypothetical protein